MALPSHTRDTFCVLWRAHRSPEGGHCLESTNACLCNYVGAAGIERARSAASKSAICLCQGGRSTSWTTSDVNTPCTSARHFRQGGAQRWTRPAGANSARTAKCQTRQLYVEVASSFAYPAPQRAWTTAPHKQALFRSRLAEGRGGDPVAPPRVSRCRLRSCPGGSRDGAVFVVDMTGVTSAVALWRPLAWSPALRARQPRVVGVTRAS